MLGKGEKMTAPILYEESYELQTEIEETVDGKILLRVEKVYDYDNVWKARNVYEKFFRQPDMFDDFPDYEPKKYYDRWISMIGNEAGMMVKEVYIYQYDTLQEAHENEKVEKNIHLRIIARNEQIRKNSEKPIDVDFLWGKWK